MPIEREAVECPWCEYQPEDREIPKLEYIDGEKKTMKCPHCEKKFKITIDRPIVYILEKL